MEEPLILLRRLQDLDHQRVKALKDRDRLEGTVDCANLATSLTKAEAFEGKSDTELNRVRSSFKQVELDLRATEAHLAQSENRLYGGEVVNPKELSQLEHRVDEERAKRSQMEMKYLTLMEELDRLEHQLKQARADVIEKRERLHESERELQRQEAENAALDREYEQERKALLHGIPDRIREKYERIQAQHPGTALVQIERGNCGGCHNALARAEIERAARMPGLATCENCGRLLAPEHDGVKISRG